MPGAEKVFDFGALSYAHPKAGPQIEKRARARFKAEEPDAVRLALARAQAARRVVGSELAAGCAERGSEKVLVLSSKKGCWLRTVPSSDNAALWLLDMIRRAACDYPQAEGTGFLPARKAAQNGPAPEAGTNAAKPENPRRKHHRGRWLLVLLLLAVLGAGYSVFAQSGHESDFDGMFQMVDDKLYGRLGDRGADISYVSAKVTALTASTDSTLTFSVTASYEEPDSGDTSEQTDTFTLVMERGAWRVGQFTMPY